MLGQDRSAAIVSRLHVNASIMCCSVVRLLSFWTRLNAFLLRVLESIIFLLLLFALILLRNGFDCFVTIICIYIYNLSICCNFYFLVDLQFAIRYYQITDNMRVESKEACSSILGLFQKCAYNKR